MLGFSAEVANDHGHLPTRCGALPAARHQQDVRGPFYASRADEERAAQKGKGAPRRKQSLRTRSEERRVGKECRLRGERDGYKEKTGFNSTISTHSNNLLSGVVRGICLPT